MKKQFKNLFTKRGLLFRRVRDGEQEIQQLVLPLCYKQDVLKGLHDEVGHPGIERTTRRVREIFFWPGLSTDVEARKKTINVDPPKNTIWEINIVQGKWTWLWKIINIGYCFKIDTFWCFSWQSHLSVTAVVIFNITKLIGGHHYNMCFHSIWTELVMHAHLFSTSFEIGQWDTLRWSLIW